MQNNIGQSSLLLSYIEKAGIAANNTAFNNNNAAVTQQTPAVQMQIEPERFELQADKDKEKSKKGKIAKAALLSATALAASIGIIAAFRHSGGFIKTMKATGEKIKQFFGKESKKANEAIKNAKHAAENMGDLQKGADNITNTKDSVFRHFCMKIPGYKKFDEWTSNLYRKTSLNAMTKTYGKAKDAISQADDAVLDALSKSGTDEKSALRIKELIAKRKSAISKFTSKDAVKARFDKLDGSMHELDKEAMKTLKGLKGEGLQSGIKKLSKESIAEAKLQESKALHKGLMSGLKRGGLSKEEAAELQELIKPLQNAEGSEVAKLTARAEKLFKKAYTKEGTDLFEKLRDINFGCAPTDILGMASTVGLLGVYTAQADTKEEKVGVSLTTGIPLLTTLATTIVATSKMISGAKALGLGLLTGFAANTVGSKINKKYQKAHNTEEAEKTIVTLDDYANKVKDLSGKKIYV